MKDLSATGFKLQVAEVIHLPDEFDLFIPVIEGTFQRYSVRAILRKAEVLGGKFITPRA